MLAMRQRVAVIGAGAAGPAALRQLVVHTDKIEATAFEQTGQVGGTWVYTEKTGLDDHGQPIHSSMYENLRTNIPKEVMAFPAFPFKKDPNSFVTHEVVKQYLDDYATHFKLTPHIKFFKKVETVEPCEEERGFIWRVSVTDVRDSSFTETNDYDAVIVCNGHYSVPLLPELCGLESFTGIVIHSHDYRHPEDYTGQRVVVLGARASGQDISLDIEPFAKEVVICNRASPIESQLPKNVSQKPTISSITGNRIHFTDGTSLSDVDTLLFCTGYKYVFPFLDIKCLPEIKDERVPLYKHLISPKYPSLSFIGIPKIVCPFPQFHCQAKLLVALINGEKTLSSQEEMEADIERDFQRRLERGMPKRYAHHFGTLQWDYNDELARLGGFDPIPRVVQKLYDDVHDIRTTDVVNYKKRSYVILDEENYEELID